MLGGKPRARNASASGTFAGGPTLPAIDWAAPGAGTRARAGPLTITCPLRARIAARGGALVWRVRTPPPGLPGNVIERSQAILPSTIFTWTGRRIVSKARVWAATSRSTPSPWRRTFSSRIRLSVAVVASAR